MIIQAIVFLPLIGALIAGLLGRSIGHRPSEFITTGLLIIAAVLSWVVFIPVAFGDGLVGATADGHTAVVKVEIMRWIQVGDMDLRWTLRVDTLTAIMLVVVNTVSALVHVYSIGYMHEDPHRSRFFAYLSLFTFAMLMLVTADNFLQMFFGWEGVGLASYLLIGFWYTKPSANAAAMKAFVVNRVGDFGFALGIFGAFFVLGHIDFDGAFHAVDEFATTGLPVMQFLGWQLDAMTVICLLLFMGAMGKSAQFLLHTWLPDAMEGPTPVSALIHAATMVTAGVYLLVRANPIFELAVDVQHLAAVLGLVTVLMAGLIALVQWDIKRVIAYSTMSQIGYMFLAAGIGAYGFAIFHLMTHAFFKALLFMSAGVVIHHLGDEQDIRRMGGLRDVLPRTHLAFLVGTVALVGLPPFAGFWSKDAILASALDLGGGLGWTLLVGGLLGVLLTGAYSFRLYYAVFHGERSELVHATAGHHEEAHGEGPLSMLVPVGILTVLSAIGGLLSIPGVWHPLSDWLEEVATPVVEPTTSREYLTSAVSVGLGIVGFLIARSAFRASRQLVPHPGTWRVLEYKLYFDELYDALFYRPAAALASALRRRVEEPVIARSLDEIGAGTIQVGGEVARVQSGLLRTYALAIAFSVAVLVVVFVAVR